MAPTEKERKAAEEQQNLTELTARMNEHLNLNTTKRDDVVFKLTTSSIVFLILFVRFSELPVGTNMKFGILFLLLSLAASILKYIFTNIYIRSDYKHREIHRLSKSSETYKEVNSWYVDLLTYGCVILFLLELVLVCMELMIHMLSFWKIKKRKRKS